jgi:hypothetical protein
MKTLTIFVLLLCLTPGFAYSKGLEIKKRAGEYEVEIRMDKNPPILGENQIEIEIKDNRGKIITDAKVLINYYMPPMPRMAPMNYKTDAKIKKERYTATMNIIMSGPWIIVIKITREGKTSSAKINVDAQ